MRIEKILIANNEPSVQKALQEQLQHYRCKTVCVSTLSKAKLCVHQDDFDLVFLGTHFPDGQGIDLLSDLNEVPSTNEKPLIVVVLDYKFIDLGVSCLKSGAFDCILKPFSLSEVDMVLKKAEVYRHLSQVNHFLSSRDEDNCLLGECEAIKTVRSLIQKVASTDATVLITGENGTGKEVVAYEIYKQSHLCDKPYVTVNCAAIPENLIESEFFGHERGAFTHALQRRIGRFELANNGTILLDEIGEVSPNLQAKLLRVLQEKKCERVGGSESITLNVRVLASTNQDLHNAIKAGKFREDLFYRLNVFPIHVPPLRERGGDILLLANDFLNRYQKKYGIPLNGFSDAAKQALMAYGWPGNVRELQNVVERAVILSNGSPSIEPKMLNINAGTATATNNDVCELLPLNEVEKRHILRVLEHTKGNRTRTASILNITTRTLSNKLKAYAANK